MKFLISSLLVLAVTGCTQTVNTHRKEFSPTERKGAWNDYYQSIKKGEEPEPPKEKE